MKQETIWLGGAPKCDVANGHALNGVFFDAYVPGYRQWGLLCPACAERFGIQLGTGKGQEYKLQDNGRWLKVAG